jgi:hypothetical protein
MATVYSDIGAEQQEEGYNRAIQIAEAGANWMLNQMARTVPGHPAGCGSPSCIPIGSFISHYVTPTPTGTIIPQALPVSDCGASTLSNYTNACQVTGMVDVEVGSQIGTATGWMPGQSGFITAFGTDWNTYSQFQGGATVTRGITVSAQPVFLSQRYVLFGGISTALPWVTNNGLYFGTTTVQSTQANGPSVTGGGFIGTNTGLSGSIAAGSSPAGARLSGPPTTAHLVSGAGSSGWAGGGYDVLQKPYAEFWPTIAQYITYVAGANNVPPNSDTWSTVSGSSLGTVSTIDAPLTNPSQMLYIGNDGNTYPVLPGAIGGNGTNGQVSIGDSPLAGGTGFSKLNSATQAQASTTFRTLILQASPNNLSGNVFYFQKLVMTPADTLVLWYPNPGAGSGVAQSSALRIFLDGSQAGSSFNITNIATNPNEGTFQAPYLFLFNGSTVTGAQNVITFSPNPGQVGAVDALHANQGSVSTSLKDVDGQPMNSPPTTVLDPLQPANTSQITLPGMIYSPNPGSQVIITPAPSPYQTVINNVVGDMVQINTGTPGSVSISPAIVEQIPQDNGFTYPPFYHIKGASGGQLFEIQPGTAESGINYLEFQYGDFQ